MKIFFLITLFIVFIIRKNKTESKSIVSNKDLNKHRDKGQTDELIWRKKTSQQGAQIRNLLNY